MVCLSRPYHLIFFKDNLSQNLLSPLVSTLYRMCRKNMLGQFWSGNTSKEVWCVFSKYHEAIWNSEKNLFLGSELHGSTPLPGLDRFIIVAPDFYKSTLPIKKQLETFGFFICYLNRNQGFHFQCISIESFWNEAFVVSSSHLSVIWISKIKSCC